MDFSCAGKVFGIGYRAVRMAAKLYPIRQPLARRAAEVRGAGGLVVHDFLLPLRKNKSRPSPGGFQVITGQPTRPFLPTRPTVG